MYQLAGAQLKTLRWQKPWDYDRPNYDSYVETVEVQRIQKRVNEFQPNWHTLWIFHLVIWIEWKKRKWNRYIYTTCLGLLMGFIVYNNEFSWDSLASILKLHLITFHSMFVQYLKIFEKETYRLMLIQSKNILERAWDLQKYTILKLLKNLIFDWHSILATRQDHKANERNEAMF